VLQYQLKRRRGNRVYRTLEHRSFRAAFDFLSLRAQSGESHQDTVDWWQSFQDCNEIGREEMVYALRKQKVKG